MPIEPNKNPDGSFKAYTPAEVAEFNIRWRGVRNGETPTLSFGISENRATATCFVNPAKFNEACLYFVGLGGTYDDAGTTRITRLLPFRLPGREGFICTKITSIKGHKYTGKDANDFPGYKEVEIELLFETPKYDLVEDIDVVHEYDRYVEPLPNDWTTESIATFGSTLLFWRDPAGADPTFAPNGQPLNANSVYKTQPKEKFSVLWWRVPYDAISDVSDLWARLQGTGDQDDVPLIGAINTAPVFGRPIGTVQLVGAKRTLDVSPVGDGTKEWRVEYMFETLPSGWNWLWYASAADPSVNGYYNINSIGFATADTVGDKDSLYAARDLLTAFEP